MENKSHTVVQHPGTTPDLNEDSALVASLLDPEIKDEFCGVLTTLSAFRQQITMLQNQVRGLEKHVNKKMKTLQREAKKNKNKGNRKPSGFAVPTRITDQLCAFMNKEKGTRVARTEVTQYIIEYIRLQGLQKSDNRKFITPDKKLATLLDVKADDEVTYFNIQRYMNKHFVKEKA